MIQIVVWALLGQQAVPALDPPAVFKRVAPSVVVVRANIAGTISLGSGVVVGPGRVATNAHVVGDATTVVLSQGDRLWRTSSIWRDKTKDIALLTVEGLDLTNRRLRGDRGMSRAVATVTAAQTSS